MINVHKFSNKFSKSEDNVNLINDVNFFENIMGMNSALNRLGRKCYWIFCFASVCEEQVQTFPLSSCNLL